MKQTQVHIKGKYVNYEKKTYQHLDNMMPFSSMNYYHDIKRGNHKHKNSKKQTNN